MIRLKLKKLKGSYFKLLLDDFFFFLEDRDECKDPIQEGAGVSNQQLLSIHDQCRDEDLWGRETAPTNNCWR